MNISSFLTSKSFAALFTCIRTFSRICKNCKLQCVTNFCSAIKKTIIQLTGSFMNGKCIRSGECSSTIFHITSIWFLTSMRPEYDQLNSIYSKYLVWHAAKCLTSNVWPHNRSVRNLYDKLGNCMDVLRYEPGNER